MKKIASKNKLNLDRETLVPLQSSDLDDVNGGTGLVCSAIRVSVRVCTTLISAAGAGQGQGGAQ